MSRNSKSRIIAFTVALACTAVALLSANAKETKTGTGQYSASRSVNRSQAETLGSAADPVRVELSDTGALGVFLDEYSPPEQFYGGYDNGTIWFAGGQTYATKYLSGSGIDIDPDEEGSLGTGTLTRSGNTASVVWNKNGLEITHSVTYSPGSRAIQQSWSLTNNTGAPLTGVKMISGGDTYFAGDDRGYAGYDSTTGTVYVMRDNTSGMMAYTSVNRPADRYFAGYYGTGANHAMAGDLPNTADASQRDQSFYLQWNKGTVNNGETVIIEAQQSYAASGAVMIAPPPAQTVLAGETPRANFLVTNATGSPVQVDFTAASSRGYTTSIVDTAGQPLASLTLQPLGSATIGVTTAIPTNAAQGQDEVTLSAAYTVGSPETVSAGALLNIVASGVHINAPAGQDVSAGGSVTYEFEVLNAYAELPSLSLGYSAATSLGYSAILETPETETLNKSQRSTVRVRVEVPSGAASGEDTLTLKANFLDVAGQPQSASGSVTTAVSGYVSGGGSSGGSDRDGGTIVYLNPRLREGGSDSATPVYMDGILWIEKKDVPGITREDDYRSRNARSMGIRATAAAIMEAGKPHIHNTLSGSDVVVQVTIPDPSKVKADTLLSGSVKGTKVERTRARFEKWFSNRFAVVSLEQQGDWGLTVRIAAKVDLKGLDTESLVFYAFDRKTNTYTRIEKPAYSIDANGYLCFHTALGGDIVITDKVLDKK